MAIIDNYNGIVDDVAAIARECGRESNSIRIVSVSKTYDASIIQKAIDSGIALFGESRVQEAKTKISNLSGDVSFHLVGHLQSNKARDAVRLFELIHSIDKFSTAERVNAEAAKSNMIQEILVQVNTSGELSKSGIAPENTVELCGRILDLTNLKLSGLMTIGPFTGDKNLIRKSFVMLRDILERVNVQLNTTMKELSMGMSSDYRIAVEEGATILRIGGAIFGARV